MSTDSFVPTAPVEPSAPARDPRTIGADRALANVLPQIVFTCDAQGELDWVNDRWYELTGLTEAETLADKGPLAVVHPDDRDELWRHWTQALETSSATELEYRIRNTAGEYRWHFARVTPVRSADGQITRWVAAVLDIHDRRLGEDARRASERLFNSLFYLSPMPMAITRQSDGRFLLVNDAFTTLTGYSRDEAVGRTPIELGILTADTRARALEHFSTGRSFEVSARTKDGRPLTLELSNAHIDIDGVPHFLSTGTDLTERRAMEDALRESEAQARAAEEALRRANRKKDDFLALLSHELRNPLTPILTSARLLEKHVDASARNDVDIIVRQVKHMSRLVDDLLDAERVARGSVSLTKTRVEPAIAIARAAAATASLFQQRHHRLEIDIPEHGLAVDADEMRLTQIFDNLLTNAALYTPPGGTVEVRGRREGNDVIIRVCDNGQGIEPSLLPDLFEIFVQGPRGADRAEGGLGLGLSVVQALTRLHGGTVTAHSNGPELGSEFTVRLPAAEPEFNKSSTESGSSSGSPNEGKGRRIRLLVVDDHPAVAEGLTRLLRELDYDVRTALNPLEAIEVAQSFRPEIALLDIGLPGMDGYTLASELRARLGKTAPVMIALSGYSQPLDLRHSQAAGFAAHLVKPVDADDLVAAITNFAPLR